MSDRVALPLPPGLFSRHCGRLFKDFPIHVSNQGAMKRLAGVQLGRAKLAILTVAQAVGLSVNTVSNVFAGSTTVNSEVRDRVHRAEQISAEVSAVRSITQSGWADGGRAQVISAYSAKPAFCLIATKVAATWVR